jgi:hypothetical protein
MVNKKKFYINYGCIFLYKEKDFPDKNFLYTIRKEFKENNYKLFF